MKLIACTSCHTQYDVAEMVPDSEFDCRCGTTLVATPAAAGDTLVRRCSGCGAIAKTDDELCDYCGAGIVQVVDRGSLICPECYARNLDDARFCLGCGVAFDPQSVASTLSELRCPCCECWMSSREIGSLEVNECPKCFGLWAPEDRFDALVDRATAAARERELDDVPAAPRVDGGNPAENDVKYRRCPVCDALMTRRNFQKRSGVVTDRCHLHGTWLDAHELERIAGFVLSGRAERVKKLDQDLKAVRDNNEARDAAFRVRTSSSDSQASYSVFGDHRRNSTIGTIFDLLTGLLN